MPKLVRLYIYELKNAYKYMCRYILIVAATVLTIMASVYSYAKNMSAAMEDSRMVFGVVLDDTSDYIFPQLVNFANNISSLKGFCRLEIFDKKEAFEKLEAEEIQMVMVVPSGFMEAAEHMQETELILYTKGELSASEYKILGLFHGVENIMLNTEGAIWAMYDGMEKYSFKCGRSEMENSIMELYVMNFLGREGYFDDVNVSAYGEYTVIQHYVVAILLLLTVLSGAAYFRLYNRQEARIETIMSNSLLYRMLTALAKIVCIALPLITQMWLFLIAGKVAVKKLEIVGTYIEKDAFIATALVGLAIASMVHLIGTVIERRAEQVTVYTLIMMLLALVSGVISSAYYLPDFLRGTTAIWPLFSWHQMIMGALWGHILNRIIVVFVIWQAAVMSFGLVLYSRKISRHE